MEKITYLIKSKLPSETLYVYVTEELVPALTNLAANNIVFGISDSLVKNASEKKLLTTAPDYNLYLSFYLPTALELDGWLARQSALELQSKLDTSTDVCHRYVVSDSCVLDPLLAVTNKTTDIAKIPGWMQLALLNQPDTLSREAWLEIWLYSHTQIAVETQSTFGYQQHIVQRALPNTDQSPDAIVTEHFPDAAMNSLDAFYDAKGDAEKQQRHEQSMMESCGRFIDFTSISVIPMSAYLVCASLS